MPLLRHFRQPTLLQIVRENLKSSPRVNFQRGYTFLLWLPLQLASRVAGVNVVAAFGLVVAPWLNSPSVTTWDFVGLESNIHDLARVANLSTFAMEKEGEDEDAMSGRHRNRRSWPTRCFFFLRVKSSRRMGLRKGLKSPALGSIFDMKVVFAFKDTWWFLALACWVILRRVEFGPYRRSRELLFFNCSCALVLKRAGFRVCGTAADESPQALCVGSIVKLQLYQVFLVTLDWICWPS